MKTKIFIVLVCVMTSFASVLAQGDHAEIKPFHLTDGACNGKNVLPGPDVDMNQAVQVFNIMENHDVFNFLDDPFMDGYDFTLRDLSNVNATFGFSLKSYNLN